MLYLTLMIAVAVFLMGWFRVDLELTVQEEMRRDPAKGRLTAVMIPLFALRFFFPQDWVKGLYVVPLLFIMARDKDWMGLAAVLLAWGGGGLALWLGREQLAVGLALASLAILLWQGWRQRKARKSAQS